jgi:hypothetical protein
MQAAAKQQSAMASVRAGGSEPQPLSVAQVRKFMQSEFTKWGRAAAAAGVRPE